MLGTNMTQWREVGKGSSLIALTRVRNSGVAIISPSMCCTAADGDEEDDGSLDVLLAPIPAARQSSTNRTNLANARVCLSLRWR